MNVFVALILTVAAFIFVFYPLFKGKRQLSGAFENEKLMELQSERDTTYSMLKELEFDYQSGILTEEDYRELEARYKNKAISNLMDMDKVAKGPQTEDKLVEIERQVKELRRSKAKTANKTVPALKKQFCTQCGMPLNENDKFCADCGSSTG